MRTLTSLRATDTGLGHGSGMLKTCFVHKINLREIFECAYFKFTVYGRKQASKHTHARAQCSHASVGLAQVRPNNSFLRMVLHIQGWFCIYEKNVSFIQPGIRTQDVLNTSQMRM